ncbi:hypothetical protein E2493_15875 [Sphingomonas parva]|uniref:Signal transduction histidine kinase internal region domain-containing protein n=1 Tax=Sphingomonas parva TaxID=2555898 RepID=A0A4Y8ZMQ8_9SPHN|nr:histidine kinase [Sphingomonas parva]TFI57280.1 hypothetical protein E2493_15875 [Sphingomonas parva]
MIENFRSGFMHTALGPAMVIWGFGYALVDFLGFLAGRTALGASLLAALPMFVLGVVLTLQLDRLREETRGRSPLLRWPLLGLAFAAATAVQASFDLYWMRWLALSFVPGWQAWALHIGSQRFAAVTILTLWTFALTLTVLWAARFNVAVEASAAKAASAEAMALQAQTAALRLQLNPHFLFNTLNSISTLMVVDRKAEAEEMIDRLSTFLRSSLEGDPMADVPLAREIDAIDAYLDIEATRFGERLAIEIAVAPGTAEASVPNFILQPLVENAIKHGIAPRRGPALLSVGAAREGDDLVLKVANRSASLERDGGASASLGAGAVPVSTNTSAVLSTGIGLANVRRRLAARYGPAARLETEAVAGGFDAVIRLPFAAAAG